MCPGRMSALDANPGPSARLEARQSRAESFLRAVENGLLVLCGCFEIRFLYS